MTDTHDTFDELETELTAMRPVAPPAVLKQRIGAELDAAPAPSPYRFWPLAAAVLVFSVWRASILARTLNEAKS